MQTADLDRSDPGFVGMMVRCRDKMLETILVVIDPLPPRSAIPVTIMGGEKSVSVTGHPIVTGAGVQVPVDLVGLVTGEWASEPILNIRIETSTTIHGAVSLQGLATPLLGLRQDCGTTPIP